MFTPAEAGAVGCVGAFLFALSRGRMWNIGEIVEVAADAVVITARIFLIGGAALLFGQFLNFAGLSGALVEFTDSFNLIVIIVVELGLITPPIGINVFTVKSVIPDVELTQIFIGVMPFVVANLVVLALIFLIPGLAIFLPSVMPSF